MGDINPTGEQIAIMDAVDTGDNVVVEALAGTGKTSTLKLCAKQAAKSDSILYIAFNRSIKEEAQATFPSRVKCSTVHGLAYGPVGSRYKHRLNGRRITARQAASILGIRDFLTFDIPGGKSTLGPDNIARLAMDAVEKFCQSDAEEVQPWHVPTPNGLEEHRNELRSIVLPYAKTAWADVQKLDGKLKFTHDNYLKLFALSEPNLPYDAIYFDEAQDSNPVKTGLVLAQKDAQLIAVGDRNQAIYGWTGAKDAMQDWPCQHRLSLTQSFRFGPAVAAQANKWLTVLDSPLRIRGFEDIDSQVVEVHGNHDDMAVLCRTNAECVATAASAQDEGMRVAIVGGTKDVRYFAEEAERLRQTGKSSHPDLAAFDSWDAVQQYVEQDGGGADLRVFVNLIGQYGTAGVMRIADNCVDEREAQIVASTAHKAKGREFDIVKIAGDFKEPTPDPETGEMKDNKPEYMLCYVATTRAQLVLDPGGISWVDNLLDQRHVAATATA